MVFLRARYLNTDTGRFHTQDTYEGNKNEPLSLHKYLYANGNPVMMTDPSGRFGLEVSVSINAQTNLAQLDQQRVQAQGAQAQGGILKVVNKSGKVPYRAAKVFRDMLIDKAKYKTHHIIEKRFLPRCPQLRNLFGSDGNMPAVILEKATHQGITNAWRAVLKCGGKEALTPQKILESARIVYKDAPTLLRSCEEILGSSAEFVGELWFWKVSKCMKQRYLQQLETPITIGFSHAQIDAQVKALDDAA